jgi:hypothetical protein
MFKRVLAVASLAVIVANVGCGAAADSAESSSSDQALANSAAVKSAGTLSLTDALAQVNAIRAKFDPTNSNALILDPNIAPAYVKAIAPIFAQVAPTDKFALAETAVTAVSNEVVSQAVITFGLFDDAVGTFADLWSFTFYYGGIQTDPQFYPKLNLVISNSSASPLADLQILSLAGNLKPADLETSLKTLHWDTARTAVSADALSIPDDSAPYEVLEEYLFGNDGYFAQDDVNAHDIDATDAYAVSMFKRSFSELRLFTQPGNEEGVNVMDLANHLNAAETNTGHRATHGIALAKSVLDASEVQMLNFHLSKS